MIPFMQLLDITITRVLLLALNIIIGAVISAFCLPFFAEAVAFAVSASCTNCTSCSDSENCFFSPSEEASLTFGCTNTNKTCSISMLIYVLQAYYVTKSIRFRISRVEGGGNINETMHFHTKMWVLWPNVSVQIHFNTLPPVYTRLQRSKTT